MLELIAVLLTGFGKFLFVDIFNFKMAYIVIACLGWIAYIIYLSKKYDNALGYFGLRKTGLKETLKVILPISAVALLVFVALGVWTEKLLFSWHIIPILLLYPIWGTIQQFLMIGLIASNLRDLQDKINLSTFGIILTVAVLFSIVHYPSYELIAGTFLLALLYTWVFLRYRNLWVLGFFHGWLGCLFYFLVLGRDPWLEKMGSI